MKEIKFIPSSEEVETVVPMPKTSKKYLPKFYTDKKNISKNDFSFSNGRVSNLNLRSCMPFLDSLRHGYIQETWCDIVIDVFDGNLNFQYYSSLLPEIISPRETPSLGEIDGYHSIEFAWKTPWIPVTPKGYSIMITHPLNRIDLPFYTLTGIIDSDDFYHAPFGNLPFYLKKDPSSSRIFIPQGTPMMQIIPIKRNDWESKQVEFDENKSIKRQNIIKKTFSGSYKNNFWKNKTFL